MNKLYFSEWSGNPQLVPDTKLLCSLYWLASHSPPIRCDILWPNLALSIESRTFACATRELKALAPMRNASSLCNVEMD